MHNETTDQLINPSPQKNSLLSNVLIQCWNLWCATKFIIEHCCSQAQKTLLAHSISNPDALTLPAQSSGWVPKFCVPSGRSPHDKISAVSMDRSHFYSASYFLQHRFYKSAFSGIKYRSSRLGYRCVIWQIFHHKWIVLYHNNDMYQDIVQCTNVF